MESKTPHYNFAEAMRCLTDTCFDSKRQGNSSPQSCSLWAFKKQVQHRSAHGKRLTSRMNPLSLQIHIKTLWTLHESGRDCISCNKVIWFAMILRQRCYGRATCGQSGEERPHSLDRHLCYTQPAAFLLSYFSIYFKFCVFILLYSNQTTMYFSYSVKIKHFFWHSFKLTLFQMY